MLVYNIYKTFQKHTFFIKRILYVYLLCEKKYYFLPNYGSTRVTTEINNVQQFVISHLSVMCVLCCQVLRYQRGGEVLWVSEEGLPTPGDIPPCVCGAPRVFEFQVCFSGIICIKNTIKTAYYTE